MKSIVVIGAGPAGAVAASYLAKEGFQVLVLEKEDFPRFVVGESLLPLCMDDLERAGLLSAVLDQGFQKKSGASFIREGQNFEILFSENFTPGYPWALQVQRMKFDQALVDGAKAHGVEFSFGNTVLAVDLNGAKKLITFQNTEGELSTLKADFLIDASGYGRVLPRLLDLEKPSTQKPRGAVFFHVRDPHRELKEFETIGIFPIPGEESWAWMIPFADGTTSLGMVGEKDRIAELASECFLGFKEFVRNFGPFDYRFENLEPVREPSLIQGYSVGVKQMYGEGFVLCGNSTEFLDPIFSSGVTLATHSGLLAAQLVSRELRGFEVDWQKEYEEVMQAGIDVFRSYVNAWYSGDLPTIFFSAGVSDTIKRQICSVLAGYVWDQSNPFVKKHRTILSTLAKVIAIQSRPMA